MSLSRVPLADALEPPEIRFDPGQLFMAPRGNFPQGTTVHELLDALDGIFSVRQPCFDPGGELLGGPVCGDRIDPPERLLGANEPLVHSRTQLSERAIG